MTDSVAVSVQHPTMLSTTTAARNLFGRPSGRNRISNREKLDHSWLPTRARNESDVITDESRVTVSSDDMAAAAKDGRQFARFTLPSSHTSSHRGNLSDGPRELDDDELMAANDDGDQLLVFGLPAEGRGYDDVLAAAAGAVLRADGNRSTPSNGDRWNDCRQDDTVAWKLLQQQYGQRPNFASIGPEVTYGGHQSINGDVAPRPYSARPLSSDVRNGRRDFDGMTENASMMSTRQYLNGVQEPADEWRQQQQRATVGRDSMSPYLIADELREPKITAEVSYPLTVNTTSANDGDNVSDGLLSPHSNGCPLSPASSVASSIRRSALPVPTWQNGTLTVTEI